MNKRMKKIFIVIILISFFSCIFYEVNAMGIWEQAKSFLREGAKNPGMLQETKNAEEKTKEIINKFFDLGIKTRSGFEELIDLLWGLGLLTIFISTVILGIKYMLVLPEEKSRIKQATTPYIIGVTIIFGCLTIWKLVIVVLDGSLQ